MASLVIYGPTYSTYLRTVRLACLAKGVDYTLTPVDLLSGETQQPAHAARHPFGKVPTIEHDGFALYETGAIVRYIDRVFPGPALQPQDPRQAARMDQILSIIDSYGYGAIIGQLAWQRLVVPMTGGTPDDAVVTAALPRVKLVLGEFERLAAGGPHLVGGSAPSRADVYHGPILAYMTGTPEAASLLADKPKLQAWWKGYSETPAMAATAPQFG
jgi:glutathione S-transferase